MPYSGYEDKNLPDYIKKLSKSLREAWVAAWTYAYNKFKDEGKAFKYANGVLMKIRKAKTEATAFEIHGEFGSIRQASELTAEELSSYGVNPSFPQYRPNCKLVTAKLVLADTPFCPSVENMPVGLNYILPKQALLENFGNIINMPVHITPDLSGHAEDGENGKKYTAIGTVLGQKIVEDSSGVWGQVLLALWDEDHPDEVEKISENKLELGTSVEFMFSGESLEQVDRRTFKIWDFIPKGLAILFKNKAAFPQTQLLVAQKSNANLQTSTNNRDTMKRIVIESDGTIESTAVFIDGVEIANIKEVSLSLYTPQDGQDPQSMNYLRLIERIDEGAKIEVNKEYRLSANGVEEAEDVSESPSLYIAEAERWTRAYINNLPDSAFAVIEPAYKEGKTENKNARHLPYKNKEGAVDLAHLRNALARMNQVQPVTDSISAEELRARAKAKLVPLAKKHLPDSKWAKSESQGGEHSMEYKGIKLEAESYTPEKVVEILRSFEASAQQTEEQQKAEAAKNDKIAELEKKVADFEAKEKANAEAEKTRQAEAKRANAKVAAEKWFEDNKASYPADQKDVLIDIRTKVELNEATPAEVLKLAELKTSGSSLATGGERQADPKELEKENLFYGIRDSRKK